MASLVWLEHGCQATGDQAPAGDILMLNVTLRECYSSFKAINVDVCHVLRRYKFEFSTAVRKEVCMR